MLRKKVEIFIILLFIFSLSNCGDANKSENKKDDSTGLPTKPITNKNSCEVKRVLDNGFDAIYKYASDGDIEIICDDKDNSEFPETKIAKNVQNLTIVDLVKVKNTILQSDNGNIIGIQTFNYKDGTIHIEEKIRLNGKIKKIDCIQTYPSPLPKTIFNQKSILDLIDWKGDINNRLKNTCSKENDSNEKPKGNFNLKIIINSTLIDSDKKKHFITIQEIISGEISILKDENTPNEATLQINSQKSENNLSLYTKDTTQFVKLSSKSSSCLVEYDIRFNVLASTTCLNLKDSNEVELFCTKDKSLCKKHSEVIFFNITNEDLTKIEISKEPPVYGEYYYNFMGGSGTGESIYIDKKGYVRETIIGIYGSSTYNIRQYDIFLKDYFIYKNFICTQEEKGAMNCTYLN